MKLALVITTYERPDALAAALHSVARQTRLPDSLVIADDGSGEETARVVRNAAKTLPLRHVWLPHEGFRAGRMRNCGLAAATGDYIVFTDDDILLHPEFIADHAAAARRGFFVQGARVLLDDAATRRALETPGHWPGFFSAGVANRKNLLRSGGLSRILSGESTTLRGIRTCNFALWREDAARVNGFYEGFVGWGREDSEFAARLLNAGVRRRNLRFAALGCHLAHPPRARDRVGDNDRILAETIEQKLIRREPGLDERLAIMNSGEGR